MRRYVQAAERLLMSAWRRLEEAEESRKIDGRRHISFELEEAFHQPWVSIETRLGWGGDCRTWA